MLKKIGAIITLVSLPLFALAADYQAGTHYIVLDEPIKASNTEVVVVNEFFGYTCPHCNSFESQLHHWAGEQTDAVAFMPVPVIFGRSWEPYAKAYFIALNLGVLEQTHQAMYDAVHIDERRMTNRKALASFFAEHGVSQAAFDRAYDSFDLQNKLRQGSRLAASAKITGVPSMLVNGKYVVNATLAGSNEGMLAVVDYLVELESQ
ncbi:MAG: thiol:disulfide interchange protein DsbA/DsbL [Gammaproteobacteria bacterium]|nr:thiol:disulfide interchange protein DsbA/DsbL [Gammaproteobacteria bacterium]